VKTTSIRELRSHIAELIDSGDSVLVTRHGKPAAVVYSLRDPARVPLEIRREIFRDITDSIAKQLDTKRVTDEEIERDFTAFKKRRRR
jgi:prevent-host-death family protein